MYTYDPAVYPTTKSLDLINLINVKQYWYGSVYVISNECDSGIS